MDDRETVFETPVGFGTRSMDGEDLATTRRAQYRATTQQSGLSYALTPLLLLRDASQEHVLIAAGSGVTPMGAASCRFVLPCLLKDVLLSS